MVVVAVALNENDDDDDSGGGRLSIDCRIMLYGVSVISAIHEFRGFRSSWK